jgi:hypothetical protein
MRTKPTFPRSIVALAIAGALATLAPAAPAQRLAATVGTPIPYRVSLPAGANISQESEFLLAETDSMYVVIGSVDIMQSWDNELPVSDAEARRIMTNVFMGSDSLLLGLVIEGVQRKFGQLNGAVTEIRTFAGQKSGYTRGDFNQDGERGSLEMHLTVKDGIMYMLIIAVRGHGNASLETLATGIRDSFALPDAPPPAATPRRNGVIRPRTGKRG